MICAGISYGHVADEETAVWLFRIHSEIWCGYFLADTIVSEWNGTASFGKGFESCIFRSKIKFYYFKKGEPKSFVEFKSYYIVKLRQKKFQK